MLPQDHSLNKIQPPGIGLFPFSVANLGMLDINSDFFVTFKNNLVITRILYH